MLRISRLGSTFLGSLRVNRSSAIEFQYYVAMLFFAPLLLSRRRASVYVFLLVTLVLALTIKDERLLFRYLPRFGLGF